VEQLDDQGIGVDHASAVADGIDAEHELERVLDAVSALPDEPRETLILHVWGELSHDEVASEMGVSVGTVKSRLHRARSRLSAARSAPRGAPAVVGAVVPVVDDGPLELGA
jgi:RNA polymerase sigma-70 factor (ECF subfamily)